MYHSGNDQAMLNCKALDHKTFAKLLKIFKPYIDSYTMDDEGDIRLLHWTEKGLWKGRKQMIMSCSCLALVLYWYWTRGSVAHGIALAFGLTSTPMYKWLKFGCWVLLHAIQNHDAAKVKFLTRNEIEIYK